MNLFRFILFLILVGLINNTTEASSPVSKYKLKFSHLATTWDEAIPLGNGMLGALIWQKDDKLRFSLDRADLWDLRPMENFSKPEFSFEWVQQQVAANNYKAAQNMFDAPYNNSPAPSKIPGAALEFNIRNLGEIRQISLSLDNALCKVIWANGTTLETFVHATKETGWFRFEGHSIDIEPILVPPQYQKEGTSGIENSVTGQDLQRLGYEQGKIEKGKDKLIYHQKGWGGFEYEVAVSWEHVGNMLCGIWSVSSSFSAETDKKTAKVIIKDDIKETDFDEAFRGHEEWWNNFWSKSSICLPDSILEKQWYLEQYKFGSAARVNTPPVSLQAVWTADNGKLPPWKGDFHHDLNTQLSYWPAYSGNHLDLEEGFINWLWKYRETFKRYTRTYFGTSGMNVPGVTTLTGEPMGGWIQYSLSPTIGCWLSHHFYLHWAYSKDKTFLREKAYPWIKDVAVYLEEISVLDKDGMRKLPISSSPEIHNNSINAWFTQTTNYDLSLIRWTFEKAAELAQELGKPGESEKWDKILDEWPDLALDEKGGLAIAPNEPYVESHRHFSHLLGWHPLGIIDWSNGEEDQKKIRFTLETLENIGPAWWCGYSYSWLGNLYARAFMGDKAAEVLRIFSENFCLPNSFHVNGDQSGKGFSKFTYRPFTLEGNFAFAAGIQEMLIQSHTGIVRIFPAVPADWENVSFDKLRTKDAFLVSAKREDGKTTSVILESERGGIIKMQNPFPDNKFKIEHADYKLVSNIIILNMTSGQKIEIKHK